MSQLVGKTELPFRSQAMKEAHDRFDLVGESDKRDAFFRGAMWAQTVLRAEQPKEDTRVVAIRDIVDAWENGKVGPISAETSALLSEIGEVIYGEGHLKQAFGEPTTERDAPNA